MTDRAPEVASPHPTVEDVNSVTLDNAIHRLSLIGYWSSPTELAEWSRGWPDPRDLTGAWNTDDRRAVLAHLRRGKVFRGFAGMSGCRICGRHLGSEELSDAVWAWPDGLDHYVEMHNIRLPEAFVATARRSDVSIPSWLASLGTELWLGSGHCAAPVSSIVERTWFVDDSTWLDWAAANTPARPAEDAVSLDEARELCRRLSHPTWNCEIDDVMGRWRLKTHANTEIERTYLQKCSATILERRLLSLRIPDTSRILEPEQANSIAAEYDGAWGALRVVVTNAEAWLVWVKPSSGDWPTEGQIDKILERDLQFGWVTFDLTNGGKSFVTPPSDDLGWRQLLTREREEGEERRKEQPIRTDAQCSDHSKEQRGALTGWWSRIRTLYSSR